MRIAVWKTGHEIADTVAQALACGLGVDHVYQAYPLKEGELTSQRLFELEFSSYDAHIGYGILRGMGDVMKACEQSNKPFFHLDRGYFNPGHYDGYYRISYKGTQAKYDPAFPITKEFDGEIQPIRKFDKSKPILVCPPTAPVKQFFSTDIDSLSLITTKCPSGSDVVIREKGDPNPINWDDYSAVVTFNSSVGWQAIQRGIPCLSDPLHSVVGSYYNTTSIDNCIEMFNNMDRKLLLNFMASHQFTLDQIRRGDAWPLIKHYTFSSVMTAEKPSLAMSVHTVSAAGLKHRFQSNI